MLAMKGWDIMKNLKIAKTRTFLVVMYAVMINLVTTVIVSAIAALFISAEVLMESTKPFCSGAAMLSGALLGGACITIACEKRSIAVNFCYSVIVMLFWCLLNFLIFQGSVDGFLPQSALILGGGMVAGLLTKNGKKGRKKRYR